MSFSAHDRPFVDIPPLPRYSHGSGSYSILDIIFLYAPHRLVTVTTPDTDRETAAMSGLTATNPVQRHSRSNSSEKSHPAQNEATPGKKFNPKIEHYFVRIMNYARQRLTLTDWASRHRTTLKTTTDVSYAWKCSTTSDCSNATRFRLGDCTLFRTSEMVAYRA
jgi:hypothetical protein